MKKKIFEKNFFFKFYEEVFFWKKILKNLIKFFLKKKFEIFFLFF